MTIIYLIKIFWFKKILFLIQRNTLFNDTKFLWSWSKIWALPVFCDEILVCFQILMNRRWNLEQSYFFRSRSIITFDQLFNFFFVWNLVWFYNRIKFTGICLVYFWVCVGWSRCIITNIFLLIVLNEVWKFFILKWMIHIRSQIELLRIALRY